MTNKADKTVSNKAKNARKSFKIKTDQSRDDKLTDFGISGF